MSLLRNSERWQKTVTATIYSQNQILSTPFVFQQLFYVKVIRRSFFGFIPCIGTLIRRKIQKPLRLAKHYSRKLHVFRRMLLCFLINQLLDLGDGTYGRLVRLLFNLNSVYVRYLFLTKLTFTGDNRESTVK